MQPFDKVQKAGHAQILFVIFINFKDSILRDLKDILSRCVKFVVHFKF